jgi:hypothetical protein
VAVINLDRHENCRVCGALCLIDKMGPWEKDGRTCVRCAGVNAKMQDDFEPRGKGLPKRTAK